MAQDNKTYLLKLLNLAEGQNSHSKKIEIFYRNKDSAYFEKVEQNGNVLPVIEKDNGGDRRSPINGSLKGVFLDTTLWSGRLPHISPFGSERIQFPIAGLFDKTTNLYFTDFYCKKTSYHHYVTLVIAKRGSDPDRFCKENLVRLNPYTNPFLRRCKGNGGEPTFTTIAEDSGDSRLHVEVFYTEEIRINELKEQYGDDRVKRTPSEIFGTGSSTHGGLAKDSSCGSCNPSTFSSDQQPHYVLTAQDDSEDEDVGENAVENGKLDDSENKEPNANQEERCINVDESEGDVTEGRQSEDTMEINDGAEKQVSGEEVKDDGTQEAPKEIDEQLKIRVDQFENLQPETIEPGLTPEEGQVQMMLEPVEVKERPTEDLNCSMAETEQPEVILPERKPEVIVDVQNSKVKEVSEPVEDRERSSEDLNCSMAETEQPEVILPEPKPEVIVDVQNSKVKEVSEPLEDRERSSEDLNCSMAETEQLEVVLHEPKPEVIVDVQNRKVKEVSELVGDREHSSEDLKYSMAAMEQPEVILPHQKPGNIGDEEVVLPEPKPEVIVDVQNRKVKEVSEPVDDREHSSEDLNCSMAEMEQPKVILPHQEPGNTGDEEVVLPEPKPEVIVDVHNRKVKEVSEPVDDREHSSEDLNCSMAEMEQPEVILPYQEPGNIGDEGDCQVSELLEGKEHSPEELNCGLSIIEQPEVILPDPKPEVNEDVKKVREVSTPLEDEEHPEHLSYSIAEFEKPEVIQTRLKPEVIVDKKKVRDMDGVHESEVKNKKRKYQELSSSDEELPPKRRLID